MDAEATREGGLFDPLGLPDAGEVGAGHRLGKCVIHARIVAIG